MSKVLIVLSGGLESSNCMVMAYAEKHELSAVSFVYGQKHSDEVFKAADVASHFGATHRIITLPSIFAGTASTLVEANELENPRMSYKDIEESYGVSPTYVPYRNGNLLSMAATVALVEEEIGRAHV